MPQSSNYVGSNSYTDEEIENDFARILQEEIDNEIINGFLLEAVEDALQQFATNTHGPDDFKGVILNRTVHTDNYQPTSELGSIGRELTWAVKNPHLCKVFYQETITCFRIQLYFDDPGSVTLMNVAL